MPRKMLIVEPDTAGHHSFWLVLMIGAFRREGWRVDVLGDLTHATVREQATLRGVDLTHCEAFPVEPGRNDPRSVVARAAELVETHGHDRVMFAFLDNLWPGFLEMPPSQARALGGRAAGVWFHPYALDERWRWAPPLGKRWTLRGRLHRFFRQGRAERLFGVVYFLDEDARARARRVSGGLGAHALPDPFEREPRLSRAEARRLLGLPADRTLFLHLGTAERRKGLPDVIDAMEALAAKGGATPGKPCLVRAGRNSALSKRSRERLERLERGGWAQVREAFVPAGELMEYFAACDWVLVPYRKFRYSSGVLANAVGAGRPVIAANYGCIGRAVRAENLGRTYRHGSVAALARELERAISRPEEARDVFAVSLAEAKRARRPELFMQAVVAPFVERPRFEV